MRLHFFVRKKYVLLIAAQVCSSALHTKVTTFKVPLSAMAVSYMYKFPTEL